MSERLAKLRRLMANYLCSLYLLRQECGAMQSGTMQASKWKRRGLAGMMDVDYVRDEGLCVSGLGVTLKLVVEDLRAM